MSTGTSTTKVSEDDTKHFRGPLRDVWALSKEAGTRASAMEILRKEIQETRKVGTELENNLEKILQESEELADEKMDWSRRIRVQDSKMDHLSQIASDRISLRERVAALEREERLTKAALKDHKIIQHRLAASRTEIKQLQQQVEELKLEKQTAIELVNKILFRGNSRSRFHAKRPLPPLRNDSFPDDSLRNHSHHDSLSRNSCSDPAESYFCPDDPLRNYSLPDPLRLDRHHSRPDNSFRSYSRTPTGSSSCLNPSSSGLELLRNDSCSESIRSSPYLDPLRGEFRSDPLIPEEDEGGNEEEPLTPKSSLNLVEDILEPLNSNEKNSFGRSGSENYCSQENSEEVLNKTNQEPSSNREDASQSPLDLRQESEKMTTEDIEGDGTLRLRQDQPETSEVPGEYTVTDESKYFTGGPVTSSPQFQKFLNTFCNVKSQ